jgi:hypothetical protein
VRLRPACRRSADGHRRTDLLAKGLGRLQVFADLWEVGEASIAAISEA